jgi:hypothetical protein
VLAPRGPGEVQGERVKFATRPNRDAPRRPTSPADEHVKRGWRDVHASLDPASAVLSAAIKPVNQLLM